jgi:hypothetical protein
MRVNLLEINVKLRVVLSWRTANAQIVASSLAMQLHLTDEEAAALINLLTGTIEGDQHPTSPRVETLRQIRAKLPGIRIKFAGAARPDKTSKSRRRSGPDRRHPDGL